MDERISKLESDIKELSERLEKYRDHLLKELASREAQMRNEQQAWRGGIETELGTLRESLKELGKSLVDAVRVTVGMADILSRLRTVMSVTSAGPKAISAHWVETYVGIVKEFMDEAPDEEIKEAVIGDARGFMDFALITAKGAGIPFSKLAPVLIEKLGKDLARALVPPEVVLKHFSPADVNTWKGLTGS